MPHYASLLVASSHDHKSALGAAATMRSRAESAPATSRLGVVRAIEEPCFVETSQKRLGREGLFLITAERSA